MRAKVILSDPPWDFSDRLEMSDVKRGAKSQYDTLDNEAIINLDVKNIAAKKSVLFLWVPSTLLVEGLRAMNKWDFEYKQNIIWVKTKNKPLEKINKQIKKYGCLNGNNDPRSIVSSFDLNDTLNFGMGRLFRQTHEICLVGIRGKGVSEMRDSKSERSVILDYPHEIVMPGKKKTKHSVKTELLQDSIERMFTSKPGSFEYVELFARRQRKGWLCLGNEAPMTYGEDIRDNIFKLSKLKKKDLHVIKNQVYGEFDNIKEVWEGLSF